MPEQRKHVKQRKASILRVARSIVVFALRNTLRHTVAAHWFLSS